jgi:hypothetical protein
LLLKLYQTQSAKTDKYGAEGFEGLTAELKAALVFQDVTQYRLVKSYPRLEEAQCMPNVGNYLPNETA